MLLAALGSLTSVRRVVFADDDDGGSRSWRQWGKNASHTGFINVEGQRIDRILSNIVYDPFVSKEQAEEDGELLAHYQVPLLDGRDVFMEFKTGRYISCNPPGSNTPGPGDTVCGPEAWNTQIWNQRRLHWVGGQLVEKWNFQTDWKPEPAEFVGEWEPVYHAALANGHVYDPGFGGTIFKLNRGDGKVVARINPFGTTIDPNTFVAGPLSADANGNVYYNALHVTKLNRFAFRVTASWLVKVAPDDSTSKVAYTDLMAPVNPPTTCVRAFSEFNPATPLPWPPTPTSMPSMGACGPQRPGVNVAPAIAPDGTIYTVSRADLNSRYSYVVAVNPDLTLKWAASMRDRGINDGCGVLIPIQSASGVPEKGKCNFGAPLGVDPQTNQMPAGRVIDQSSSSPTVLPDGSVLYGAYTRYNIARGHYFKFSSTGQFLASFDFGWDTTPAVFGDATDYHIVIKDNHYDEEAGFYCNPSGIPPSNLVCASTGIPAGPFFITQLDKNLVPEWQFHSIETQSCTRQPDGSLSCVSDHPNGFEWCINAPAIDANNNVYAESEDGNAYVIPQGHTGIFDMTSPDVQRIFMQLALGAAYTPLSIGRDGKIYTQNGGHLFVLGDRD